MNYRPSQPSVSVFDADRISRSYQQFRPTSIVCGIMGYVGANLVLSLKYCIPTSGEGRREKSKGLQIDAPRYFTNTFQPFDAPERATI